MRDKLDSIMADLEGDSVNLDLFRECYRVHFYEEQGERPVGTLACGSAAVDDTPKALYRLLYLLEPRSVDFSEMYKSDGVIEIHSPDYQFCAAVQFYEYKLGLYFHCAVEHRGGMSECVQDCISELGQRWYEVLVECLNHELSVYPGNDFVV